MSEQAPLLRVYWTAVVHCLSARRNEQFLLTPRFSEVHREQERGIRFSGFRAPKFSSYLIARKLSSLLRP